MKTQPRPGHVANADLAVIRDDAVAHDGQSEADAALIRASLLERTKQVFACREPAAFILHLDEGAARCRCCIDPEGDVAIRRLNLNALAKGFTPIGTAPGVRQAAAAAAGLESSGSSG
jgi:hypothetical protein